MITNPKASSVEVQECKLWFNTLPQRNYTVMLPEITDYEVRRELLRVGKIKSIRRLDRLKLQLPYLALLPSRYKITYLPSPFVPFVSFVVNSKSVFFEWEGSNNGNNAFSRSVMGRSKT
jgi:hypothetical protein